MNIPALHGNWVDLLILVFLAIYAWGSWEEGFLVLLARMGSFLGSFLLALKYYAFGAQLLIANFSLPRGIANAGSFIVLAIGFEIALGYLLTYIYNRLPKKFFQSQWNRLLAPIPAIADGLIIVAFLSTLIISLPVSGALKFSVLQSRLGGELVRNTEATEKTLTDVFGGAAQDTLSFLTINPGSKDNVSLHFTTTDFTIDAASEQQMLVLVNQERTSRGLKALVMDEKLREIARAHSQDMFARGYFSHYTPEGASPFDRMKAAGISFEAAGENIAYAPTLSLAHTGLMNSPEHRANILSPDFGKIGIGIINAGIYGEMFTQDFTN